MILMSRRRNEQRLQVKIASRKIQVDSAEMVYRENENLSQESTTETTRNGLAFRTPDGVPKR